MRAGSCRRGALRSCARPYILVGLGWLGGTALVGWLLHAAVQDGPDEGPADPPNALLLALLAGGLMLVGAATPLALLFGVPQTPAGRLHIGTKP